MLEWNDYPIILAISRGKSLYKAAQSLGVAVSTVMRRVEQIEVRAGVSIFRKTEMGYIPTSTGALLLAKAEEMEGIAGAADNALKAELSRAQNKLRISASEVIAPFFVARHISTLQAASPSQDIILSVTAQSPSKSADEFDISLWPSTPSNEDLFGRKLTALKWAYFGRPSEDDPQDQTKTSEQDAIRFFGRDGAEQVNRAGAKAGADAKSLASNSLIAAAAMAAAGGRPAFLPCLLGGCWPGLRPLCAPQAHEIGELWAIYRKSDARNPRIRTVVDALAKAASADANLFHGA